MRGQPVPAWALPCRCPGACSRPAPTRGRCRASLTCAWRMGRFWAWTHACTPLFAKRLRMLLAIGGPCLVQPGTSRGSGWDISPAASAPGLAVSGISGSVQQPSSKILAASGGLPQIQIVQGLHAAHSALLSPWLPRSAAQAATVISWEEP